MELPNPLDRENPIRVTHVVCHGTRWHLGARRPMTATETFAMFRRFWLKYYDAMEVLIMDQGTEFGHDSQHLRQYRDTLLVVTDPETPWSNPVVERHEALFKMALEKACSLEAPTTEAEVDELIDFTFAELKRRVERAGFSTSQRASGRQLRLPSSLLEGDAISAGRQSREAAKRGHAKGSRPRMRSRRQQQGDDSSSLQTTETSVGAGDWRNRLHTQMEERSPRMGWTWCLRVERRSEIWKERDTHCPLVSHCQQSPRILCTRCFVP